METGPLIKSATFVGTPTLTTEKIEVFTDWYNQSLAAMNKETGALLGNYYSGYACAMEDVLATLYDMDLEIVVKSNKISFKKKLLVVGVLAGVSLAVIAWNKRAVTKDEFVEFGDQAKKTVEENVDKAKKIVHEKVDKIINIEDITKK